MTSDSRLRAIGTAAVGATLVMFACGKSGSSGAGAKSSDGAKATGSVSGLKYAPTVAVMEHGEGLAALKEISTNGSLLLFAGHNSTIAALHPGSVLLIKGLLAKKVLAVAEDDGDIGVLTEPASITDVVQEAHIVYDYPVRFSPGGVVNTALDSDTESANDWLASDLFVQTARAAPPPDAPEAPAAAQMKTCVVKDWTVEVTATPGNDRVNLKVK